MEPKSAQHTIGWPISPCSEPKQRAHSSLLAAGSFNSEETAEKRFVQEIGSSEKESSAADTWMIASPGSGPGCFGQHSLVRPPLPLDAVGGFKPSHRINRFTVSVMFKNRGNSTQDQVSLFKCLPILGDIAGDHGLVTGLLLNIKFVVFMEKFYHNMFITALLCPGVKIYPMIQSHRQGAISRLGQL